MKQQQPEIPKQPKVPEVTPAAPEKPQMPGQPEITPEHANEQESRPVELPPQKEKE